MDFSNFISSFAQQGEDEYILEFDFQDKNIGVFKFGIEKFYGNSFVLRTRQHHSALLNTIEQILMYYEKFAHKSFCTQKGSDSFKLMVLLGKNLNDNKAVFYDIINVRDNVYNLFLQPGNTAVEIFNDIDTNLNKFLDTFYMNRTFREFLADSGKKFDLHEIITNDSLRLLNAEKSQKLSLGYSWEKCSKLTFNFLNECLVPNK